MPRSLQTPSTWRERPGPGRPGLGGLLPVTVRRRKLIEVSLPLDAINRASAREKLIRHGHPSTLHLWWARRPLAACRAVLFAQLVDDPSAWPEEFPTEEDQARERARLHTIIAEMVPWVATHEPRILNKAQFEIARSLARARGEASPAPRDQRSVLAYLLGALVGVHGGVRLYSAITGAAVSCGCSGRLGCGVR